MEPLQAIILGIVQGLTEFLPVSSSGHLILFQNMFGLHEPELFFDVCLHVGTLIAVICVYYKDLLDMVMSIFKALPRLIRKECSIPELYRTPEIKMAVFIVLGSVPTAVIGLMLNKIADRIFSSIVIVGAMLLITGTFLWASRYIKKPGTSVTGFSLKGALIIGFIQGCAVMPGISRSGSTIVMGQFLGLNRETAAKFSFLLCIPAIFGAALLKFKETLESSQVAIDQAVILGTVTSFVIGYIALRVLIHLVKQGRLYAFAPYCWIIGLLALAIGIL